jgi:hypothetical protein
MTTKENPAPRSNAESRANSKSQRSDNRGSEHRWKARPTIDFKAIKEAAKAASPAVLARILPGGKVIGGEYVVLNPCRFDRHLGSFRINLRTGKWADFAVADARGNDFISLIAYVKALSQYEAAKGLSQMLGVGRRR